MIYTHYTRAYHSRLWCNLLIFFVRDPNIETTILPDPSGSASFSGKVVGKKTSGQSNLTKSASLGAHSPVMGHPRGSKVVPLNSWGRVSY